jgi:3-hydroxymyristoyl/3-hydroxydecanoyl-(acyl carrier protein) dehydratase
MTTRPVEHARREHGGDGGWVHEQDLELPAELVFFQGHFPGAPVLAGAAQLEALVLPGVAQVRPDLGPLARATRIKFHRPLGPGDRVTLHMSFPPAGPQGGQVGFRITRDAVVCTAGTLHFAPVAATAHGVG